MSSRGIVAVGVLLGASVGVNAWLSSRVHTLTAAVAQASARAADAEAKSNEGDPELGNCHAKLARCQDRNLQIAAHAAVNDATPKPSTSGSPNAVPSGGDADATNERAALVAKATESLRDSWTKDKDKIAKEMNRSLHDINEQSATTRQGAIDMATVLHLDPEKAEALAHDYEGMRAARLRTSTAALEHDPPDFTVVADSARALFSDEDALAQRYGGDDGKKALRTARVEGRTMFLAMLVTLAGRPIDEAVGW